MTTPLPSPSGPEEVARPARVGRAVVPLALLILLLDQASKLLVHRLVPLHATIPVIPGMLNLTHVRNTGAAFGLMNAAEFPFKPAVMALIAAAALAAIGLYAWRTPARSLAARIGFGLILGGACGNLIDRLRSGHVIDFVDVYWRHYHFWAFNVADSAITVGAALLIFDMLAARRHVPEAH